MSILDSLLFGVREIWRAGVQFTSRTGIEFSSAFTLTDNPATKRTEIGFSAEAGLGDVVGPDSVISGRLAVFDGATGKIIAASPYSTASLLAASGDVDGPASAVDQRIAVFDGTTGKLIEDGGMTIAEILAGVLTVSGSDNSIVRFNGDDQLQASPVFMDDSGNITLAGGQLRQRGFDLQAATVSADQNNYSPSSWAAADHYTFTPSGANRTITGFASIASSAGQRWKHCRNGSSTLSLTLTHQSTSSSSANRIVGNGGFDTVIPPLGSWIMFYEGTGSLGWIILAAQLPLQAGYLLGGTIDAVVADTSNLLRVRAADNTADELLVFRRTTGEGGSRTELKGPDALGANPAGTLLLQGGDGISGTGSTAGVAGQGVTIRAGVSGGAVDGAAADGAHVTITAADGPVASGSGTDGDGGSVFARAGNGLDGGDFEIGAGNSDTPANSGVIRLGTVSGTQHGRAVEIAAIPFVTTEDTQAASASIEVDASLGDDHVISSDLSADTTIDIINLDVGMSGTVLFAADATPRTITILANGTAPNWKVDPFPTEIPGSWMGVLTYQRTSLGVLVSLVLAFEVGA